ncbi:MAG: hypothetical protein HYU77_15285 [Betaproteobacteria bacterium]|nr:hypothetical protein [Betaproteobacteria bacterium]
MLALVLLLPGSTISDITTTKHNMARLVGAAIQGREDNQVCVYCHAPRARPADPAPRPATLLWQRRGSGTFIIYNDMGRLDLNEAPGIGSTSVMCLSCHDGSQAFGITRQTYDHPFGVPYRGNIAGTAATAVAMAPVQDSDLPFKTAHTRPFADFRPAQSAIVGNHRVWWVPTSPDSVTRRKTDLPLYERNSGPDGESIPFVECTSCHDPHNDNVAFLRITNEQSRLCLGCHDK